MRGAPEQALAAVGSVFFERALLYGGNPYALAQVAIVAAVAVMVLGPGSERQALEDVFAGLPVFGVVSSKIGKVRYRAGEPYRRRYARIGRAIRRNR